MSRDDEAAGGSEGGAGERREPGAGRDAGGPGVGGDPGAAGRDDAGTSGSTRSGAGDTGAGAAGAGPGSRGEEGAGTGDDEGPGGRSRGRRGDHTWGDALHDVQETVGDMVGEVLEGVRDVAIGRRFPRVDVVHVEGEGYRVLMDLPGVQKGDLEVTTMGGELTVAGRRRPPELPEEAEALRSERGHGRFRRSVRLPADARVEGVRATLEDGVLMVRVPEAEPGDARTVEID